MTPIAGITEELYLGDYASREELEADCDFWDATTAGWYAWCPRLAQYSHRLGLRERQEALTLLTGNAIHAGMNVLYSSGDEDLAVQAVSDIFGDREPLAPGGSYAHLHSGFVENVFKNYLPWRKKHDVFEPVVVHMDDLDLTDVVAAVWRILPDERVILGECKIVMRFIVDGEEFIYAMKPDLPILLGGQLYLMDHKVSCGGYLSDWYFEKHLVSNQLRGYCRGMEKLLNKRFAGAYINGIYAGDKALATKTKAGKPTTITKFTRFGPMDFSSAHLDEALWNQYAWRIMAFALEELAEQHPKMYKQFGYPQNTGKSCQGCHMLETCQMNPRTRMATMRAKFTQKKQRKFLDL